MKSTIRRHILQSGAATAAGLILPSLAQTKSLNYPERTIHLVVPFPPGGPTDIVARPLGLILERTLRTSVVLDNKGGAGGNIAAEFVAKAPADGYTLMVGTVGTHAINPSLYKKVNYDPLKDFVPLAIVAQAPVVLVINPNVPANNVQELVALGKNQLQLLNYGTAGAGTPGHLAGEMFRATTRTGLTHIPYRGSALAVPDLLAGRLQAMFDPLQSVLPHIKAGKLKAIAVTGKERSSYLPNVPTVAESGYPDYELMAWWGVFAPAATPESVVNLLRNDLDSIKRSDYFKLKLEALGATAHTVSAKSAKSFVESEIVRWKKAVEQSGASA